MMRFTFLVLASVQATQVSPVQKVIELLDELKAKVAGDLQAEETMMEEYTKWCDEEENTKEDAITSGKRTVGDLNAVITDSNARIGELSSEIEELAGKIAAADADLKKATGIREEENGSFTATEGELTETIDTLGRATAVLSRGQFSFLQQHGAKGLSALKAGLEQIVEATWVNSKQKAVVQSLLQSAAQEDDEDLSLQPQATAASYSSQGGGILDSLKDMTEKAEGTLSDARAEEMKAEHAYAMLKQSLEQELKTMNKRMAAATAEKAGTEKAMQDASEQLTATQKTLDSDTKYLEELRMSCSNKAAEWAQRQKDAAEEMGAIAKAKEVLSEGVKVFLQVSAKTLVRDNVDSVKRNQVVAAIQKIAKTSHTYFLTQLVTSAKSDTFGKVKGLIESMIDRLEKEAAEEADAKAFCDTETEKSRAKQADLSAKLDMHGVRIEKATAGIAELKVQIKALQEQMAAMDQAEAEATALRQKEHAEYEKASSDYSLSAEAVAKATAVLQQYYSQGSFVQTKQAPELGGAQSDIGATIVSMLEVAESDFTRLLAEAEAGEKAAQASYDKLSQENAVARAANTEEVKGKENEVGRLDMSLLNYKEDHQSTSKELDAVLEYLDKLKPQCETKVMSYAERKARREAEIEGLKEALTILSA
jgi:chromosome segregation ATPase